MKTKKIILGLAISAIACIACEKDDITNLDKTNSNDLVSVFKKSVKEPEKFKVNATKGGQIETTKGILYTVKPNSLVKKDGSIVQGEVDITISEITTASEMILNDMPTNAIVTPNDSLPEIDSIFAFNNNNNANEMGVMLNSFGEIKVEAAQNGEELDLKAGSSIAIEIPQKAVEEPIVLESIPIWDYVPTTVQTMLYGHNSENESVSHSVTSTENKEVQIGSHWQEPSTPAVQVPSSSNSSSPSLAFSYYSLNNWVNCDQLITSFNNTTVLGYFTNVFNDSTEGSSYTGIQANMLFFKAKDQNICVKLYEKIIDAPAGKQGLLSYQNCFAVGMEGAFLAVTTKNGKFYAQKLATTIQEPKAGKNYHGINFVLKEITETELIELVKSMD